MPLLNKCCRWVLSPLETVPSPMEEQELRRCQKAGLSDEETAAALAAVSGQYPPFQLPIVRQYTAHYEAPFHGDGFALVYCELDVTHLAAAQKDDRLTIFAGLDDEVPAALANSYARLLQGPGKSAAAPAKLRDVLDRMKDYHCSFGAV